MFRRVLDGLRKRWNPGRWQLCGKRYRLQHDNPLVNKSCKDASMKECVWQWALVGGMMPVHLASTLALHVGKVLNVEIELERGGEVHLLTQLQPDHIQILSVY